MDLCYWPRFKHHHAVWLLLLLFALSIPLSANDTSTAEYKLKAVLIYKLVRFVEWPEGDHKASNTFKICLLGRDDFGSALDALEKRRLKDKPIKIRRFAQSEALEEDCRVVFISASKQPFIVSIVNSLKHLPILTVGDTEHFARQGGMIQFTLQQQKIGFQINLKKAEISKLKIAAPLLQISTIVETRNKRRNQ